VLIGIARAVTKHRKFAWLNFVENVTIFGI